MVLIHGVLLHGRLKVRITQAADLWLPQERSVREKLTRAVICHSSLNPYVTVALEHLPKPSKRLLKTHSIPATDHPTWDHVQEVDVATNVSYLIVHVKSAGSQDATGNPSWAPRKSLGFVRIKAEHVLWNVVDGWFPLTGLHGIHHERGAPKNRGRIHITVVYSPVDAMMLFGQPSVPGTYYSASEGCHVQLFQDAHCPAGAVLEVAGSSDKMYAEGMEGGKGGDQPPMGTTLKRRRYTNYFEQIYYSVLNSRKLVYISGWSVDTTLHLLRKGPDDTSGSDSTRSGPESQMSLGELLKFKASQGVVVLLLVWDEVLSTSNALVRIKGIMDTKDEVTRAFFRSSHVKAAIVPRLGGMSGKVIKAPLVSCLFTFHEKVVITDIPAFNPRNRGDRELVAFCGGLDLTYGRWDTPQHAPFSTLDTEHAKDFYNGCFDVSKSSGPREPWHDVAAMITGPVVRDFVQSFEERWRRQGLGANLLVDLDADHGIVDGKFEHETEQWTVQVFRSIDERSAVFDKEAARRLERKKGRSIDRSIHHAYVHYVRAANRFIYIEQQYFLGSSNQWLANGHKDGTNLIPHELALKVVQGILTGNFLRAYVVIPMFPEGIASDSFVQQILFYQMRTIEMIMRKVADAIAEAGLKDVHPTDFIAFFCLGNREPAETQESPKDAGNSFDSDSSASFDAPPVIPLRRRSSSGRRPVGRRSAEVLRRRLSGSSTVSVRPSFRRGPTTADEEQLGMSRRQPIYQHAKVFISDDEVLITGSANLNERSMCGVRDTEIAFSAFQPAHRYSPDPYESDRLPRGEVARFRRRLWAEHALGCRKKVFTPVLEDPGTLECMRELHRIARRNWLDYTSPRVCQLRSHLLPYPYNVDQHGNISGSVVVFPDTRGSVTGTNSGVVPNLLVS